jgi:ribosomal protein S18 acetylase RimI-like enzyme
VLTTGVDVRELTTADRDQAVALWRAAGLTRPWNEPVADFDRAIGSPSSAVLGATDTGGVAATVMVGHDGHRGWVYYLATDPDRRGSGLGRRMMAAAEVWLREHGAVKLNLMVRRENTGVMDFYARLGYTTDDVVVLSRRLVE